MSIADRIFIVKDLLSKNLYLSGFSRYQIVFTLSHLRLLVFLITDVVIKFDIFRIV